MEGAGGGIIYMCGGGEARGGMKGQRGYLHRERVLGYLQ